MKVLVIDTGGGVGLDLSLRSHRAGHDVRYYNAPGKHPNVGKGLVPRVEKWEPSMRWADLIIMTDSAKYRQDLEPYFKKGFPILGTNPDAAMLELDREFGQKVLGQCGIETVPFQTFHDYGTAEIFVRKEMRRFVSKPWGDADRSLSYVSKSPADLLYMLRRWSRADKLKGCFMLQEFVPGIEVGVSGWFGPGGWLGVWEENFEHKKLMNGEKGITTGEMGTAVKFVERSALAEKVLEPLGPALAGLNFVGNCDINCIVDQKGRVWPLEFTVRLGWPDYYIQAALQRGDPINWMGDLLEGRDTLRVSMDHAIGVVVAIPDFPYSHLTGKEVEGVPLYGVNEKNFDRVRLGEVMAGCAPCMNGDKVVEQDLFVTAGDYVACVVGRGASVREAHHMAYGTVDEIEIPNSPAYRTDIGLRLEDELPVLKDLGFCKEWRW